MKVFMNTLGWCMWQVMHWLVGMERVKRCASGWPDSCFGMTGSMERLWPVLPADA